MGQLNAANSRHTVDAQFLITTERSVCFAAMMCNHNNKTTKQWQTEYFQVLDKKTSPKEA